MCRVHPARVAGKAESASSTEASCGHSLRIDHHRIFIADPCARGRLRGTGEQEMIWAYALSCAVALALLVYLVVALVRAEDL
jgi:K+-transporting ATPase KdpF subunit